jgi:hypothetical protein
VNPRNEGRTNKCDHNQARTRMTHANKFLDVAELVASDVDVEPGTASVAAALAVLAGIAASDVACCAKLGRRFRGQDHRQAVNLVRQVSAGGPEAAKNLSQLLDLKDTAYYGVIHVTTVELKSAIRRAKAIVKFAEANLRT